MSEDPILFSTVQDLVSSSLLHTSSMFLHNHPTKTPDFTSAAKLKLKCKLFSDYGLQNSEEKELTSLHSSLQKKMNPKIDFQSQPQTQPQPQTENGGSGVGGLINEINPKLSKIPTKFLIGQSFGGSLQAPSNNAIVAVDHHEPGESRVLSLKNKQALKPEWHAPWKLMRVISGHQGWVRSIAVDWSNQWFASGSNDRTIKIWDLASGQLKITLTGHINTVRGLEVSKKHAYLFSCGEDKTVRCWDLEYNKVIRNYHGHLSGVYCLTLHPTLDVLISGGRDSTCRVWDIRTRSQVHCLSGHSHVVSSLISQEFEPQVVSGSHDSTIRLWDLAMGKSVHTLTNHKKAVRSMFFHPTEYTFTSAAHDNLKVWKCPEGEFLRNIGGHQEILNCVAVNRDNVLVAGGDKGSLHFWDYKTGYMFQTLKSKVQPGSISAEGGIFNAVFDHSSLRMITAECDKTIKIWKEDETATPETHPIKNYMVSTQTYGNY